MFSPSIIRSQFGRLLYLSLLAGGILAPDAARAIVAEPNSRLAGVIADQPSRQRTEVSPNQLAAAEVARRNGVLVEWNRVFGTPQRLRGTNLFTALSPSLGKHVISGDRTWAQKAVDVMAYLQLLYDDSAFGLSFQPRKTECDDLGFWHVRLQQSLLGLPVVGPELIVHFNREGKPYQVNGEAIRHRSLNLVSGITAESAAESATRWLSSEGGIPLRAEPQPALVVFALRSAPRLAYEINLSPWEGGSSPVRWRAWVDASDGTLILAYNDIHFIAPPSGNGVHVQIKGNILPAEGGQAVSVTGWLENSGAYYLHNTNWSWQVYNLGTSGPDAATYAFRYDDSWGLSDPTEISAARNFDFTQGYFWAMHGLRSFDDAGIFAQANVHYSLNYPNAFWSGAAFYFGDGNGTTAGSMVTLDIAAHEYTHAVTDYSAQLIYADESGALNESFSDIFGVCVEFYAQADNRSVYPTNIPGTADWLMGEDCWLAAPALRDIRDPSNILTVGTQRHPSRYRGTYWFVGIGDNGGVHWNSGVQNFFFYLLSEGGTGTNDGIAYNVAGIGITNAAQVAFRALTVYCTPATDYQAVRGAWVSAAQDLDTNWVASVADAWSAVGIGSLRASPAAIDFRGPPGGPFACLAPEITLYNWGTMPLEWGMISTQAWVEASPSSGVIPPLGTTTIALATTSLAETLPAALYTNNFVITNQSEAGELCAQVRLYIGQPDPYTEVFDNNDLDLAYSTLTFTPDGSASFYSVCREPAVEFPTDPAGGINLALGDDTFAQLILSGTNTIGIYGQTTNEFFLGSNGYLTLGSGDESNLPTLANHFSHARVAALLNDLDPAEGGTVTWMETSDRLVVTFQGVPIFGNPALTNSFQIEMFYDGVIRVTYLNLAFENGLAGLSAGDGIPTAFSESDLLSYPGCHPFLRFVAPTQTSEGENILIAQAFVSIPFSLTTNLYIQLHSSDTNEILVQTTTLIIAGITNVSLDLTVVDDARIDGTRDVTLTASAAGWGDGQTTVAVHDNESTALTLVIPGTAHELSGVLTNEGQVAISGTLATNLSIEVVADDPAAVGVPFEVIIPAGEISRRFDLTLLDNLDASGPYPVTITVSAAGFLAATNSMLVVDDETPPVPFDPAPTNLAVNVAQTNDLSWQNGAVAGQGITNYVYLGTNEVLGLPDLVGITTNTTLELALLAPQTIYYWQVVAHNVGVTPGPVWQFSTRGIDHFEWAAVSSPQYSGEAISVALVARDEHGGVVSNYAGLVGLSATAGDATNNSIGLDLTPTNCGTFVDGAWTGTLILAEPGTNIVLWARNAEGKSGASNPFNTLVPNDLEIVSVEQPASVFLGGYLTNLIRVFNTGPSNASAVGISYSLPAGLSLVLAVTSQGSADLTNNEVVLGDIGTLTNNEVATMTVVTRPTIGGLLTNSINVTRSEADARLNNNFAEVITEVISPVLMVTNVLVAEGNGETNVDLWLQLSVASPFAITMDFATTDGEAIAGVDFVSTNGTLTFSPGETNLALPLTILGDTVVEPDETFQIVLTNIANGQLATSNVTFTIRNDDFPPPPPQIMLLTELNPTNGLLSILLTNLLGSALSETNVAMYRSTNLDLPDWGLLTNQFVSTNGMLRIENLDTRDLPAQYFRARQVP